MAGSRRWSIEQSERLYNVARSYWPRSGLNPGLWDVYRERLEPLYPPELVEEALRELRKDSDRETFPTVPAVALWCKDVAEKFRKQMTPLEERMEPAVSPQQVAENEEFWRDRLSGPNSEFYMRMRARLRQGASAFETLWQ